MLPETRYFLPAEQALALILSTDADPVSETFVDGSTFASTAPNGVVTEIDLDFGTGDVIITGSRFLQPDGALIAELVGFSMFIGNEASPPAGLALRKTVMSDADDVFDLFAQAGAAPGEPVDLTDIRLDFGGGFDQLVFDLPFEAVDLGPLAPGRVAVTYAGTTGEALDLERVAFTDGSIDIREDGSLSGLGFGEGLSFAEARSVAYLYEAGLDRDGDIDLPGLNFWIDQREAGLSERQLSQAFLESGEFTAAFGEAFDRDSPDFLTNRALVEQLYRNVLNREGETAGVDFWTGLVASPAFTRADLLLAFAGSPENVAGSPAVEGLAETSPGEWEFLTL